MEQLNLKAKNFKDLLTDEPFTRKDIITIQVCRSFNVLKSIAAIMLVKKCKNEKKKCLIVFYVVNFSNVKLVILVYQLK